MVTSNAAAREIVRLLPAVAANLRLAALFDPQADLTANQLLALELVATAPDARMMAGELAGRMGISSQAATALVDRHAGAGVVARSQGDDRRVVWVSVTDEGRSILGRLEAGLVGLIEAAIEASDDDPATLDALVDGMGRVARFAARIGGPPARPVAADRPAAAEGRPPP